MKNFEYWEDYEHVYIISAPSKVLATEIKGRLEMVLGLPYITRSDGMHWKCNSNDELKAWHGNKGYIKCLTWKNNQWREEWNSEYEPGDINWLVY